MSDAPPSDANPNQQFTLSDLLARLAHLKEQSLDPKLQIVELKEGEILFEEGDVGDSMYIVVAGVLGVRIRQPDGTDQLIDKLDLGATVGELALISGQPRSATVFAINDAGLIRLSQTEFDELTETDPQALGDMKATSMARWQRLQLAAVLHNLLGELDANELHQLQDQLTWHTFSNGDVLFRQGDAAEGMFVVVNGRLRAVVEASPGDEQTIVEITAGETVGEFALFTAEKRTATVYAVRETNAVYLSKAVFENLSRQRPEWMGKLAHILVQRRRRALAQVPTAPSSSLNFALVPADDSINIRQFAQELTAALTKFGSAISLDSQQFDERYGRSGAAQTLPDAPENVALSSWIGEMEASHAHVFYLADESPTAWTQRCVNRADRVLIVANPQADPTPGMVEQYLAQLEVPLRTELVLWHPAGTDYPKDTLRWLQPRHVLHHHHIRQEDAAHMRRLARRLSGNGIGLVFSGGAALGLTQQGVYRALLELDIPLDYVGGVSMGSIMGGMVAIGASYAEFEEHSRWSEKLGVLDYTLPLAALTRSKNVMQILKSAYERFEIEDLWIPYFCISSSLTRAEPKIHQRGSMWRAIRASMAIPGVFLPVVEDGEVLVDGGIMDNYPVATMAELLESRHIITVLVSPFKEKKRQYDYDTHLSGWKVLWHRLNPFNKRLRLPSPADTLIWSMEIHGRRTSRDQEGLAELTISPNVKGFGVTDYDRWRELAQLGYETALEPLRQWQAVCEAL